VGVEIEEAYFDQTCARIEAAQRDGFMQIRAEWERDRVRNNLKGLAYAA
jgi:site-specific DNA-methyltransferase (adenine-specific)